MNFENEQFVLREDLIPNIIHEIIFVNKKFNNSGFNFFLGDYWIEISYKNSSYYLFVASISNNLFLFLKKENMIIYKNEFSKLHLKKELINILNIIKKERNKNV